MRALLKVAVLLLIASCSTPKPEPQPQPEPEPQPQPQPQPDPAKIDKGPIGYDVYRQLDRLPELTRGVQTLQFSGFDRTGGNNDGFEGTYSCLRQDASGCVLAEAAGAGEIQSIWFTRDGGDVTRTGNIRVELDGQTVFDAPLQDVVNGKLGAPFIYPLVANADQSSGGVYIKVPMPYRESMRVTTAHNPFFYHVSYRSFDSVEGVSTFNKSDQAMDVINTLLNAGRADPKPAQPGAVTVSGSLKLAAGEGAVLAEVPGPGMITALRVRIPQLEGTSLGALATDDGRAFGQGGYSEFTVSINPNNEGVILKRRLDAIIGLQRSAVLVDGVKVAEWAGMPPAPLSEWRDESVTLPASATAGKSSIVIRNAFISSDFDFNEFTYWVESIVNGTPVLTDTVNVGAESLANEQAHSYAIGNQTWNGVRTYRYPMTGNVAAVAASDDVLRNARLRITFDGEQTVDAPLGEFFGSGLGENDVRSLFFGMETTPDGWYSSWWPMPYRQSARVELHNGSGTPISAGDVEVTYALNSKWATMLGPNGEASYFRATSHQGEPRLGEDWVFLDTAGQGKFVGVSHSMEATVQWWADEFGRRAYLEGDERVYVDGSRTPQMHGTGSEDFYEAGWYFNRELFSAPTNGNSSHEVRGFGCQLDCTGAFRLMIGDAVPFHSSLRFTIEHGPLSDFPVKYSSTAYWYGRSQAALRSTDVLTVGDTASEAAHGYTTGSSDTRYEVTSSYEGDFDDVVSKEAVRAESRAVTFTVNVDKDNHGVILRRTSDQTNAYQAARVRVNGVDAGLWLQPLGNASRRWLDDVFQIPATLTAKHSTLTIQLTPSEGRPAWNAAQYEVLSHVEPFSDSQPPTQVVGLVAESNRTTSSTLRWARATDDVSVARYQVYGSKTPGFTPGPQTLLGETTGSGFLHHGGLKETWHYQVRAVDRAGNMGRFSAEVAGRTGAVLAIEAESLLPATGETAPAVRQGNCCGISWSGGAQLWFQSGAANASFTVSFEVPKAGRYKMSAIVTRAIDYGIFTASVDGNPVGQPYDAYSPMLQVQPASYGELELAAGKHTLTITVTGKNPESRWFLAGLDLLELELLN